MKCKECGGSGWIQDILTDEVWECDKCNGKGVVEPLTNEEWLHTLNTEQLAEWLTFKRKLIRIPETNYEAWLRWLKEKHHE